MKTKVKTRLIAHTRRRVTSHSKSQLPLRLPTSQKLLMRRPICCSAKIDAISIPCSQAPPRIFVPMWTCTLTCKRGGPQSRATNIGWSKQ